MGDCTVGKELKQSTCRYVKKCKPGWVRNNKFICRKTLRRTGKQSKNSPTGIIRQLFGTPSPSPNNRKPKLTNKELAELFESPEEEFKLNLEPRQIGEKSRKSKSRKTNQSKGKPRNIKPRNIKPRTAKPRTNVKQRTSFNNLQNSPNVKFDLNKFKRGAQSRLQKTSDLKRREQIKQREREGMNRYARKIARKYNV
jgi:hypothetical protein